MVFFNTFEVIVKETKIIGHKNSFDNQNCERTVNKPRVPQY